MKKKLTKDKMLILLMDAADKAIRSNGLSRIKVEDIEIDGCAAYLVAKGKEVSLESKAYDTPILTLDTEWHLIAMARLFSLAIENL